MANQGSTGFGFRPILNAAGGSYHGVARPYYVPASDSTALYIGDAVVRPTTGSANTAIVLASGEVGGAVNFAVGTLPVVTRATNGAGNPITGIVVRVGYDPTDNQRVEYRKGSTAAVVWVVDDVNCLFEAKMSAALAVTNVGGTVSMTGSGGSTITGLSAATLNSADIKTSAGTTEQFRIIAVSRDPLNNDLASSYAHVYVRINNSTEAAAGLAARSS